MLLSLLVGKMEFAITLFNNSVMFALKHISQASLQLSSHQMSALQSSLSGKDTFVCLRNGQGNANSARDMLVFSFGSRLDEANSARK